METSDDFDGRVILWDIETNGLLNTLDRIHCLVLSDVKGNQKTFVDNHPDYPGIKEGLTILGRAEIRVAHNGIAFDEAVVSKLYPTWTPLPGSHPLDTYLLSRMVYPDIRNQGINNAVIPPAMRGSHALGAWGLRLGQPKDEYVKLRSAELMETYPDMTPKEAKEAVWDDVNPLMIQYCQGDVRTLRILFLYLNKNTPPVSAVRMEHQFAAVMRLQEIRGVGFDMEGALRLNDTLQRRSTELENQMIEEFGSRWRIDKTGADEDGLISPKTEREVKLTHFPDITKQRVSEKTGKLLKPYVGPPKATYVPGAPYMKVYRHQFNPSSRDDCVLALKENYGWKPSVYTEKGAAKLDEQVLLGLQDEIPTAGTIIEYLMCSKRRGQLTEGNKAWIKYAELDEATGRYRIHGTVNSLGAYTSRCTHANPNLAQVPAGLDSVPYGKECRSLFRPTVDGWLMAGSDADALELRVFAHYLAPLDGGAFAKAVHEGDKSKGTDAHSLYRDAVGTDLLGEGAVGRDKGKTLRYALLYGCGIQKAGSIIIPEGSIKAQREMGKAIQERMSKNLKAEAELAERVKEAAERRGYIVSIDGRKLPVRKAHAALNTLLQSGGAIIMKKTLVVHLADMIKAGYPLGEGWHYMLNIHDEIQSEVDESMIDVYTQIINQAFTKAGEMLGTRCPIIGSTDIGTTWADTH